MAIDTRKCAGCLIEGQYQPVHTVGPEDARFTVVTDVPSQAAAKEKRLLPPATMKVFANEMRELGFGQDDFRFTPACHCPYNTDTTPNKVKTAIHKHCRVHLVDDIRATKPECIVPLGALAATQSIGRATKITKVRGLPQDSEEFGAPIFPLLSPAQVVMYPQNLPIFRADVQSFGRFFDHGYDAASASTEHGEYVFVDDLQFLIDQDPEIVAFDMENTSLRHYQHGVDVRTYRADRKGDPTFIPRAQILTMQFTVEQGKSYVLAWDHPERPIPEADKPRLRNQLRQLLCKPSRIVIGQHLKYDIGYLWACEGIRPRIGGDTLMLAQLVDENAMEKNLDVLTKIYAPEMAGYADLFNATYDKSRMWEVPLDEIRGYGGGDTDACYRVYFPLEEIVMNDERLWNHYIRVSLPGLNGFVGLERRGMHVDTGGAMTDFRELMEVEVAKAKASLLKQIPREIKIEHIEKMKGDADKALSFSRTALLRDILFTHPKGFKLKPKVFTKGTEKLPDELKEPSTSSKDHLPFFFDSCPFTFELSEYIKNERLLSTNVVSFKNKYVVDDMVRPTYGLTKAVTGRTNSDDPNGQNYPKRGKMAKTYGKQFIAPPGYYMIAPDLSQAELRIAASMANEPTMIEIYRNGGDIHRATAMIILGVAEEQFQQLTESAQKEARQKAKACIAAGQLVLTKERGQVPIEDVKITDHLWDGVEWVTHEGINYQGVRHVMDYSGMAATPEHFVYTDIGAMPFYLARELGLPVISESKNNGAITFYYGIIEDVPYLKGKLHESITTESIARKAEGYGYRNHVLMHRHTSSGIVWYEEAAQGVGRGLPLLGVRGDQTNIRGRGHSRVDVQLRMPARGEVCARPARPDSGGEVRRNQTALSGYGAGHSGELRRTRDRESVQGSRTLHSVYVERGAAPYLQGRGHRQSGQRGALRTGEHALVASRGESSQQAHQPLGGVSRHPMRGSGFARGDKESTPDLRLRKSHGEHVGMARSVTGGHRFPVVCQEPAKTYRANTYDPLNAGPNHRFTLAGGQTVVQCNFGFLYGMWWKKFIVYAKTQYGVDFTPREAEQIRKNFFKKYNRLEPWHNRVKEFVTEHGFMRSYTGRIRHLPTVGSSEDYIVQEALRQGINSPVQETGSSLGVMAIGRMNEEIDSRYLPVVGFIHDSIIAYVRKQYLDWGLKTLIGYMQSTPMQDWFGTDIKVPIVADASFGNNFGELIECPGFKLDTPYSFNGLVDKKGNPLLAEPVPPQIIPPNDGRLTRSVYTLDTDLEPLDAAIIEEMVDNSFKRVRRSSRPLRAA